jgi:hypothetical protein
MKEKAECKNRKKKQREMSTNPPRPGGIRGNMKKKKSIKPIDSVEETKKDAKKSAKELGKAKAKAAIKRIKKAIKPKTNAVKVPKTTNRGKIAKSVKDIFKGKDLEKGLKAKIASKKSAKSAAKAAKEEVKKAAAVAKEVAKSVTKKVAK